MSAFVGLRSAHGRMIGVASGVLVVLMVGFLAGSARAQPNPDKQRPFEYAQSYTVIDPADEPGAGFEHPTSVEWASVGQARLGSRCSAAYDSATGQWGVGVFALTVVNDGTGPVVVTWPENPSGPPAEAHRVRVLQPGEMEAFFRIGQVTTNGGDGNFAVPGGGTGIFGILNENGPSVTGIISWVARWEPSDKTGRCTFSLQMKG